MQFIDLLYFDMHFVQCVSIFQILVKSTNWNDKMLTNANRLMF